MPTVTASAKTAIQQGPAGVMTKEQFAQLLVAGTDDVFKRGLDFPFQGEMLYQMDSTNKDTETFQSVVGLGNISQNRDVEEMPSDEQQQGFAHSITTYVYRGKIGFERRLMEDELYGQIRDNSEELLNGARRTVELILADGINRGDGATASVGAPFICEDGFYLFDAARVNPHAKAGTWSNVEATSAITANSIFTAQLNFRAQKNERGHLDPKTMNTIIIRPTDEVSTWELLKSDLRPADSMNAKNFQFGRWQYKVYDHMTTAQILYKAEGKNELKGMWRVRPGVETFMDGNPDVTWQRVRFRFGIGALRPDVWRQGIVS